MYTNPNSTTANFCTWCVLRPSVPTVANVNPDLISSWLAYNLLSACTDCQGFPQAVQKYVLLKVMLQRSLKLKLFAASYLISNHAKVLQPQRIGRFFPASSSCTIHLCVYSYFPSNYSLPEGTLIPYWATYDRQFPPAILRYDWLI